MGIGPWAQGDLIRDVQKAERARWRRAIGRLEADLWRDLDLRSSRQDDSRIAVSLALEKMRASVNPKKLQKK